MEVLFTFQVKVFLDNKNSIYLLLEIKSFLSLKRFLSFIKKVLIIAKNLSRRQIKDSSYSEGATCSQIVFLIFLSKSPKEFIFDNSLQVRSFTKKSNSFKLTKNLVIITRSLWTRCSITKFIYQSSHLHIPSFPLFGYVLILMDPSFPFKCKRNN